MKSLRKHSRFLASFGAGLILTMALWEGQGLSLVHGVVMGFDAFALTYLALSIGHISGMTALDLRRHVEDQDEGMTLIFLLGAAAVSVSLWAIVTVLNGQVGGPFLTAMALVAVPLGWAMVQVVAAFHYANLHHRADANAPLQFPGTAKPGPWDFLYFAFTIGMTAQVSDVTVGTMRLRRAVLLHSILSFFYNTVILALAVNAGLKLI